MKLKNTHILLLIAIFTLASPLSLLAEGGEGDVQNQENMQIQSQDNQDQNKAGEANKFEEDSNEVNATSSDEQGNNSEDRGDMGDRHGKMMEGILSGLNQIGDNENDNEIGDEIKGIAQDEASSTGRRVEAMQGIEHMNFVSKFMFGPDTGKIKNLNAELNITDNSINRLEKVKEKIASSTLQTQLDEQIKSLQDARAKVEAFIKENESSFSLFGWFRSLFR